ncbi:MAP7 domain-containing protein 1-like isoform X4 [Leptopilina heterotoma]|uniref:MAP7 domain-containing protein 1-like isoform X4 n=1 Tax=Leptopilina heterotoma TaxID=63436 RepID=UPI001CA9A5D6|nr:MAP7 domain-containing protein 1-like isoform X4 [Leptopilina heterotoma]
MFSELCRETLRKAAVCYSSGRTGSPSPSPPTSPPQSPAKEAKTSANAELANVRDPNFEVKDAGTSNYKRSTEIRDFTSRRSSSVEFREKRPAMPTDFSRRSSSLDGRRSPYTTSDTRDYARSTASDKGNFDENEETHDGGKRERKYIWKSPGSSPEPDDSSTSGDEAGAAPDENSQRSSSAHHRHSLTKEQTMHWFAQLGGEDISIHPPDVRRRSIFSEDSLDGEDPYENQGRESTGSAKDVDRAKLVRERQNEERQRKLEELRKQALAAQRSLELREEKRRKRIDELRSRDNDRRIQVEEKKRLIWEAERERREAILRKNQEREARIEAKRRNERSHIVFAFGSSTPRMLEPADTGGSTFWGTRRATSTTNVMMFPTALPLTRRSSERELDNNKKRATSAGGLDRKPGEDMRMSSSMYEVFNWNTSSDPPLTPAKNKRASLSLPPTTDIFAFDDKSYSNARSPLIHRGACGDDSDASPGTPSSAYLRVNRRRTDLMPTIPSPRDGPPSSARSSSSKAFTRSPGIRSGEATPNSHSRPHSSMSQQSACSVGNSIVNLRPRTATPRRPRPASIAGTGVSIPERHNVLGEMKLTKDSKPPLPKVHSTPKKPSTPKAAEIIRKPSDKLIKSARASPRVTPKATPVQSPGVEHVPLIRENTTEIIRPFEGKDIKLDEKLEEKIDQGSEKIEIQQDVKQEVKVIEMKKEAKLSEAVTTTMAKSTQEESNLENLSTSTQDIAPKKKDDKSGKKSPELDSKSEIEIDEQIDMSASMIAKIKITTEEEAKAALAERRRIAREQAEREAELERLRLEEEARLEVERQRAEEEEQRRLEEETLRLANEAKQAEEQRLRLAIEEATKREEEDRKKREEEAKQKQEKEEAEKKAREEAEKQRIEMAERLKKEEEERIARRKRVEAIMLRTRGKNQSNSNKGEGGDGDKSKEDSPSDESKAMPGDKVDDIMTASLISEATQQFISGEQNAHRQENNSTPDIVRNGMHTNGINENKTILDNNQDNGGELNGHHTNHGNGINTQTIVLDNATVKQNNVTNNLLDLSEFDNLSNSGSGPILELTPNLANEDTLNSNLNPTAMPFTPMANSFVSATNANTNPFQDVFNNKQDNQVTDLLS